MCGIFGSQSFLPINIINKFNIASSQELKNRGPDNFQLWQDQKDGICLGHNRLSIVDLSDKGNQPMKSFCGRYVITYNGMIYNYLELKKKLETEKKFNNWIGASDTEVLLNSFSLIGIEKTLEFVDGMFALALWDIKEKELTLIRDRCGEKPLFYFLKNKNIFFSSSLNSFYSLDLFDKKLNNKSVELYFQYGNIPNPSSIYKNIFKLKPGSYLKFNFNKNKFLSEKIYWNSKNIYTNIKNKNSKHSKIEIDEQFYDIFKKSVSKRMLSDAPIGSFLSGGMDSSLTTCIMQELSLNKVKTFSIGNYSNQNEANYSKKISNILNTDHEEYYLTSQDVKFYLPKIPYVYDEPFADSSQIPTLLVSNIAKKKVKVCLTGDGGDELFCGYSRYNNAVNLWNMSKYIPFAFKKFNKLLLSKITSQNRTILYSNKILRAYNLLNLSNLNEINENLKSITDYSILRNDYRSTSIDNSNQQIKFLDQKDLMFNDLSTYLSDDILHKVDKATMYNSIETRTPFLDKDLIEFSWSIPFKYLSDGYKANKKIFNSILFKFFHKETFDRPKEGFGFPLASLIRKSLKNDIVGEILEGSLIRDKIFNKIIIDKIIKNHLSSSHDFSYIIWYMYVFQIWINKNKPLM